MGDFERELLGSSYTKAKVVTMKNNARGHRGWNCARIMEFRTVTSCEGMPGHLPKKISTAKSKIRRSRDGEGGFCKV